MIQLTGAQKRYGPKILFENVDWLVTSNEPGRFDYSRAGELLKCPWHGWAYDIRTGQSWCDPDDTKVKSYEVTVEPGAALVRAAVQQRKIFAAVIEHADLAAAEGHQFPPARRNLARGGHHVPGHRLSAARTPRARCRRRSCGARLRSC